MRVLSVFGLLVAITFAQDTARFTNTSFTGPFTAGQNVPIMWTLGNGEPVSLWIANSTWRYSVFDNRAVSPSTYDWMVIASPGFVSGEYQLSLTQIGGGVDNSPRFNVIVADNATTTTSMMPAAVTTATVTYVYYEEECGCMKTKTAMTVPNTGMPATTSMWWDHDCGCTKSAMVPVSVAPAVSNYTVPAAPPVAVASATPTTSMSPSNTGSNEAATFTGEAVRLGSSAIGLVALLAAMIAA